MKLLLPFNLEEAHLYNEKGEKVKGIISIQTFKEGIVVLTEEGLYTNVKSLLKKTKKV